MAVGVSGQGGLMLRIPPDRTDDLMTREHTRPFEMRGKPMDGWLRVPAEAVTDDAELARWVQVGVAQAEALPPK